MPTATGVEMLEKTVHKTHEWLRDLEAELGVDDRHYALQCLRGALHILRDRLPLQEAAHLGSQLPTLIRGIYYENWDPAALPVKSRTPGEFLGGLLAYFPREHNPNTELIARSVFRVLRRHVSDGEIMDIQANFPRVLMQLWS